jgi:hypothetical protein
VGRRLTQINWEVALKIAEEGRAETLFELAKILDVGYTTLSRRYSKEMTPDQVQRLREALKIGKNFRGRAPVQPCGTVAAYRRHLRHREEPCEPCKQAERDKMRQKRDYWKDNQDKIPAKVHGTVEGYRYYSCRCQGCSKAASDDHKAYRTYTKLYREIMGDEI